MFERQLFSHNGREMCRLCWVHELRRADMASVGKLVEILRDKMICAYCGEPACEVEHVIPRRSGEPTWTVPSCKECNRLAGGKLFYTFTEKRDYIHERIRKKYLSVIKTAEFDSDEMDEFGPGLRGMLGAALDAKAIVEQRLGFQLEFATVSDPRLGGG